MQYVITLPADYDMDIIHQRIASKGHMTDYFAGLAFKAYLVRERGKDGSTLNQYAPFYLWRSDKGMAQFLWGGGGFGGIVESFGRPVVRHWTMTVTSLSDSTLRTSRWATRIDRSLSSEVDLQEQVVHLREQQETWMAQGALLSVAGINTERWETTEFCLWAKPPGAGEATLYQVRHVSQPELGSLHDWRKIGPLGLGIAAVMERKLGVQGQRSGFGSV